jgi:hypothetical protein
VRAYLRDMARKILAGNQFLPDLNTLTEIKDIGGKVRAYPVSGGTQDRGDKGRRGPLTIGSGDMDAAELLMGVAEALQQSEKASTAITRTELPQAGHILNGFVEIHSGFTGAIVARRTPTCRRLKCLPIVHL